MIKVSLAGPEIQTLSSKMTFCSVLLHKSEHPNHTNEHCEHTYWNTVVNTYLHYSTGYSGSFHADNSSANWADWDTVVLPNFAITVQVYWFIAYLQFWAIWAQKAERQTDQIHCTSYLFCIIYTGAKISITTGKCVQAVTVTDHDFAYTFL